MRPTIEQGGTVLERHNKIEVQWDSRSWSLPGKLLIAVVLMYLLTQILQLCLLALPVEVRGFYEPNPPSTAHSSLRQHHRRRCLF